MKKLLILFGLNNLVLGLFIIWVQFDDPERFDFTLENVFAYSLIIILMVAAVGLPLRNRFAWSANFILSTVVVVIAPLFTYLMVEFGSFEYVMRNVLSQGPRLLGIYAVFGIAIFSIIRTLKQDITQLLQITLIQKRFTVIAGSLVSVVLVWLYFS